MARARYWSCSKFADWLRGTAKPHAESISGWRSWRDASKGARPIRYWLAEEGLDYLQNFVMWPVDKLYDVKYYINNRWVTGTHHLTAHSRDIKPGSWCDVGNRFLPCLFNELVDFVEVEQAWHHVAWDLEARKQFNAPFYATGWFRWRTWRCKEAGLAYLEWARNLKIDENYCVKPDNKDFGKPTQQAVAAQEILDLYTWWTVARPARPDAYDASGWTEMNERRRAARGDKDEDIWDILEERPGEDREETRRVLDLVSEIEAKYEQEDENMLIRLIKIRNSLWT